MGGVFMTAWIGRLLGTNALMLQWLLGKAVDENQRFFGWKEDK